MSTWVLLRAAGIAAYLLLFASVAWGLIATTQLLGTRVSRATATVVHHFLGTAALGLLAVHLGGLLVDRFVRFDLLDLVVPFRTSYRPTAVALGVFAMYGLIVVIATSWARKWLGSPWWRRVHLLAAPTFSLALVHGILAGSDSSRPWMWITYVATGLFVVFLLVLRGLTTRAHGNSVKVPDAGGQPALPVTSPPH